MDQLLSSPIFANERSDAMVWVLGFVISDVGFIEIAEPLWMVTESAETRHQLGWITLTYQLVQEFVHPQQPFFLRGGGGEVSWQHPQKRFTFGFGSSALCTEPFVYDF